MIKELFKDYPSQKANVEILTAKLKLLTIDYEDECSSCTPIYDNMPKGSGQISDNTGSTVDRIIKLQLKMEEDKAKIVKMIKSSQAKMAIIDEIIDKIDDVRLKILLDLKFRKDYTYPRILNELEKENIYTTENALTWQIKNYFAKLEDKEKGEENNVKN